MIAYLSKTGAATQLLLLLLKDYHRVVRLLVVTFVISLNSETNKQKTHQSHFCSLFFYTLKKKCYYVATK